MSDVAGVGSVVVGRVAEGGDIGIAWLDGPGRVAGSDGMDVAWLVEVWVTVELSNLTPLRTIGAVILQMGKSPGFKLQLTFYLYQGRFNKLSLGFLIRCEYQPGSFKVK